MAELAARLHALRAAREARDLETYLYRWGVMLGTLSRRGYRLQAVPVPIDPADRWRLALHTELARGRAAFDDADGHTLLHHLAPPD
jgi:hypothetical protein